MSKLEQEIREHIKCIDKLMDFSSFSDKTLDDWCRSLIEVMTAEGAVPYLLGDSKERYRASPLASVIISMNMANLLPDTAIDMMQNELLFLRDNPLEEDKHKTSREKEEEDRAGWSLSEGVSVWSTSLAIIALLENNELGKNKAEQYKDSILWLTEQQDTDSSGWGYQLWLNCEPNVIMSSLALRALVAAYKCKDVFSFDDHEKRILNDSIIKGFNYLKNNIRFSGKGIYWTFKEQPHCAATTWALLALKKMSDAEISVEIKKFYSDNVMSGLAFLVNKMPKKIEKWKSEQIVCEAGAKYSKQKNYFSFSAALLLELFEVGMSPYHPKVIKQIKWLLNNVEEWKIEEYDTGEKCSFTYAMVLSTIVKWVTLVGKENAYSLTRINLKKYVSLLEKIYGMPVMTQQRFQIIYKPQMYKNITSGIIGVAALLFMINIWKYITRLATWLMTFWGHSKEDFILGVIESMIAAAGVAVITFFGHLFVKQIKRWEI